MMHSKTKEPVFTPKHTNINVYTNKKCVCAQPQRPVRFSCPAKPYPQFLAGQGGQGQADIL